jgi:hypothetical protein
MFVRFHQTSRRLHISLVETRREPGKVRHEHIASLGSIRQPPEIGGRVEFWQRLFERLGRLGNRLDGTRQMAILAAVDARVPLPTQEELQALRLEQAKQHEATWRMRHVHTEGIVEEQKARLKHAQRLVTEGEPLLAAAVRELKAAEDRRERIERGEDVPLPGKPPIYSALLKQLNITSARARLWREFAKALGEDDIDAFVEWKVRREGTVRRERATLHAFLRSRS